MKMKLAAPCVGTARVELIGPEEAARILEGNQQNYRKLKPRLVSRYASDMSRGLWSLTTGGIGIDVDGNLTNGQHRLNAVIESGVPCWFVVVRNMPVGACQDPNEDTGSKRSVATHLQNMGVENSSSVASAARSLWAIRSYLVRPGKVVEQLSDAMVAKIIAADETIAECVAVVRPVRSVATMRVASTWYWLARFEDESLANECVQVLAGHAESSTTHAFVKLRDVLLKHRADKKTQGGMEADLQLRYFMAAWEKAKSNEPVKLLRPVAGVVISDGASHALQEMGR